MLKEKLLWKKFLFFNADSSLKAVINCIPSHSRSLSTIQYAGSVKIANVSSLEEFKAGFEKKENEKTSNNQTHNPNMLMEGLLLPLFSKMHSQSPYHLRNK